MAIYGSNVHQLLRQSIINDHGRTKDGLAFRILRLFFSPPFPPRRPKFSAAEVTMLLAASESTVCSILTQLEREDFLVEDPKQSGLYQYNYHCAHVDQQVELEKSFL